MACGVFAFLLSFCLSPFAFRFLLLSSCSAFVLLSCLASCLACFHALLVLLPCLVCYCVLVVFIVSFSLSDVQTKRKGAKVLPLVSSLRVLLI